MMTKAPLGARLAATRSYSWTRSLLIRRTDFGSASLRFRTSRMTRVIRWLHAPESTNTPHVRHAPHRPVECLKTSRPFQVKFLHGYNFDTSGELQKSQQFPPRGKRSCVP